MKQASPPDREESRSANTPCATEPNEHEIQNNSSNAVPMVFIVRIMLIGLGTPQKIQTLFPPYPADSEIINQT
jgi:hypothetical protein